MIINLRALEILIWLARHDVAEGYAHSSISMARALQKYISEFTENRIIHHPAQNSILFDDFIQSVYKNVIEELETLREK